jgi:hypothetical protein
MFKMKNVTQFSPTVKKKQLTDGFSEVLKETAEYFSENNIDIFHGFREILTEDGLFDEYMSRLTEGSGADEVDELQQLFLNNRYTTLMEATFEQIAPLQSLSMPVIRKMWARTALKNAIPTEVAKLPTFVIAYKMPYLKDTTGAKHYLPEVLYGTNDRVELPKVYAEFLAMTIFANATGSDNLLTRTVIGGVPASAQNNDAINPILYIDTIKIEVPNDSGVELKEVKVMSKMTLDSKFYIPIKTKSAHVLPANQVDVVDTLLGQLNCTTGEYSLASVKGLVKEFKFAGTLVQDANTRTDVVGFDVKKKEVNIGHGAHLDAPIPIEFLQDAMALYNIDGTVEVIDIMSNVMSQKIDIKLRDFIVDSFDKVTAGNTTYPHGGYSFTGTFDVKPSAGFAGTPTQWRDELKTQIEWWANKLKHHTKFTQGYFVVLGNPVDVQLISDIDWQFTGTNAQKGGVNIDYNVGVLTSHNSFNFVASDNMPQGKLRMIFCPNVNDYMTYKYYPYTFNIQKDYRSAQMSLVPNIMMTKRDAVEEFIPMQVVVNILHNDGSLISSYALVP